MPEEDNGASGEATTPKRCLSAGGGRASGRSAGSEDEDPVGSGPRSPAPPRPPGLTRFVYPGAVPVQLPLNLLLAPQLHESSPVLHSLSLFGKFPVDGEETGHQVQAAP